MSAPVVVPRDDNRAVSRPAPVARLVTWRPAPRPSGALHGYATVDFNGWCVADIQIFRDADGALSAGVPGVPDLDANGKQRERDGKKQWRQIISFTAPDGRGRWQRAVLAAVAAAGIGGAP
jgi:hypothetical protein